MSEVFISLLPNPILRRHCVEKRNPFALSTGKLAIVFSNRQYLNTIKNLCLHLGIMDSGSQRNNAGGRSWCFYAGQKLLNILTTTLSTLTLSLSKGECHNFMVRQAHHEGRGMAHHEDGRKIQKHNRHKK